MVISWRPKWPDLTMEMKFAFVTITVVFIGVCALIVGLEMKQNGAIRGGAYVSLVILSVVYGFTLYVVYRVLKGRQLRYQAYFQTVTNNASPATVSEIWRVEEIESEIPPEKQDWMTDRIKKYGLYQSCIQDSVFTQLNHNQTPQETVRANVCVCEFCDLYYYFPPLG